MGCEVKRQGVLTTALGQEPFGLGRDLAHETLAEPHPFAGYVTLPIYEIGGRDGGYPVILKHFIIGNDDGILNSHTGGKHFNAFPTSRVQAHPYDLQALRLISLVQIVEVGYGRSAWGTPCCPEIEQDYLAPQLGEGYGFSVDTGQGEIGGKRPPLLGSLIFAAYRELDENGDKKRHAVLQPS